MHDGALDTNPEMERAMKLRWFASTKSITKYGCMYGSISAEWGVEMKGSWCGSDCASKDSRHNCCMAVQKDS
jgi:hypothetical protein